MVQKGGRPVAFRDTGALPTTTEVSAAPDADDLAFLSGRLTAFNDADVGPSQRLALAVFERDAAGKILAGLSGYTAWGWLYVQWLWVDDSLRRRGIAGRMLDAAESEALRRGCHGALIDTFSPVALKSYMKQGYEPFGVLEDFPVGRSRTFLRKPLRPT